MALASAHFSSTASGLRETRRGGVPIRLTEFLFVLKPGVKTEFGRIAEE
jgi:hypothetical protein